jgi:hypothetical protein
MYRTFHSGSSVNFRMSDTSIDKPVFEKIHQTEARNRFLQYHAVRGQPWSKLRFSTVCSKSHNMFF